MNAPDDEVRGLAVIALNEIGGGGPAILPAMIDALHDSNEMVRKRAARVLGDWAKTRCPPCRTLTFVCATSRLPFGSNVRHHWAGSAPKRSRVCPICLPCSSKRMCASARSFRARYRKFGKAAVEHIMVIMAGCGTADAGKMLRIARSDGLPRGCSGRSVVGGLRRCRARGSLRRAASARAAAAASLTPAGRLRNSDLPLSKIEER